MSLFATPTLNKTLDEQWQQYVGQGLPGIIPPRLNTLDDLLTHHEVLAKLIREQTARKLSASVFILPPDRVGTVSLDAVRLHRMRARDSNAIETASISFLRWTIIEVLRTFANSFQDGQPGISPVYGGVSEAADALSARVECWVHFGPNIRMNLSPQVARAGSTFSFSISHFILYRQPWMARHPDTHSWWTGLAEAPAVHLEQPSGLYYEAWQKISQGRRFYQLRKWGAPLFFEQGPADQMVQVSEAYKSPFCFAVGDQAFPHASPVGTLLGHATKLINDLYGAFLNNAAITTAGE